MGALISYQSVFKKLSGKTILSNITVDITQNEVFGLIGPSGAGKTTFLRCMIGFYKINKGKILFNGKDISRSEKEIRKIFGFTTQDNCFYEKLTVWENLVYFGRLYNVPLKQINITATNLLKLVELSGHEKDLAMNLSGGMQRRLDLACSLMHAPKILILDEPTAGLDPTLRKHMLELIKKINQSGTTIIISSHLLNEIEHLCTRIGIINKGELLKVDKPSALKDQYCKDEEVILESFPGKYRQIVAQLKKMKVPLNYVKVDDHRLVIYTPQAELVLKFLLRVIDAMHEKILDVTVNRPSLNEVFAALTEKQRIRGMDEDKVIDYMKAALKKGYNKDQIRGTLMKQGWPEDAVNAALFKIG
jgi:ABC-2 type transport system ATP-binding protein